MDQIFTLSGILGILSFISLVGGAAGYYKASRGDSIIKYQEKESKLKDETIARLEKEGIAKDAKILALTDANEQAQEQITFLQNLAQGSPQLLKLTEAIKAQTKIITQAFKKESKK